MFKIGNIEFKNNLILSPMAGYTNSCYRNMMRDAGASLAYTEMISDKAILFDNDKTMDMADCNKDNGYTSLQLFGYDIDEMVKAAKIMEEKSGCDIIDINMGCPVKKVIKSFSGSYLMTELEHSKELVRAIVNAVKIPVTVKIRLGWDHSSINCVEFARAMEEAGASAIAIHGRTKSDMYSGSVNLDYIKKVKESVKIPVIGNGDIKSYKDAKYFLEYTGVDALMIGRASLGNPWIFEEIVNGFNGEEFIKPNLDERLDKMLYHLDGLVKLKGEYIGVLEMRSMAGWYLKGLKNTKPFKEKITNIKTKEELETIVKEYRQWIRKREENED